MSSICKINFANYNQLKSIPTASYICTDTKGVHLKRII